MEWVAMGGIGKVYRILRHDRANVSLLGVESQILGVRNPAATQGNLFNLRSYIASSTVNCALHIAPFNERRSIAMSTCNCATSPQEQREEIRLPHDVQTVGALAQCPFALTRCNR